MVQSPATAPSHCQISPSAPSNYVLPFTGQTTLHILHWTDPSSHPSLDRPLFTSFTGQTTLHWTDHSSHPSLDRPLFTSFTGQTTLHILHWTDHSSHPHKTTKYRVSAHFLRYLKRGNKRRGTICVTDLFSEFAFNLVCSHSKQILLKCAVRRIISITHVTVVIPDAYTL